MKKAVTLIELLISMALLSVIILAAVSFNVTGSNMLKSSEKKTTVLNEITYIIERIQKNATQALGRNGDAGIYPGPGYVAASSAGAGGILFRPANPADLTQPGTVWVGYYRKIRPDFFYNLVYCPDVDYTSAYNAWNGGGGFPICNVNEEVLTQRINVFQVDALGNSVASYSVNVSLDASYNNTQTINPSTNPQVIVNTTIFPSQQSLS